jgi:hypothetical protein
VEADETRRQRLAALRMRVRNTGERLTVHDYEAGYAGLTIDASFDETTPSRLRGSARNVTCNLDSSRSSTKTWYGFGELVRSFSAQADIVFSRRAIHDLGRFGTTGSIADDVLDTLGKLCG